MYLEEETLRVKLPCEGPTQKLVYTLSAQTLTTRIKSLMIVQPSYSYYGCYEQENMLLTIPDTIINLTDLEAITITAFVKTLPRCLSQLPKLQLLDLSGCYNILSIPAEVLAMPNLKIKIGEVITPASEVVIIKIPKHGISADIFTVLSDTNAKRFSQVIIHQEPEDSFSFSDEREEVIIPDNLYRLSRLKSIWMRGNIIKIPRWIFKQKHLKVLGLSGHFDSLSAMIGEMKELTTLDLENCAKLESLPDEIGNLSKLTSLK